MTKNEYYRGGDIIKDLPGNCIDALIQINQMFSEEMVRSYDGMIVPLSIVGEMEVNDRHIMIAPEKQSTDGTIEQWDIAWEMVNPNSDKLIKKCNAPIDNRSIPNFQDDYNSWYDSIIMENNDSEKKISAVGIMIINLNEELGKLAGDECRFNVMPDWLFFELFVYNLLRSRCTTERVDYKKRTTFLPSAKGNNSLFEEQMIIPDILIKNNDKTIILDAKYKHLKKTTHSFYSDQYQLSAYMLRLGAKIGYLVYPGNINSFNNTRRTATRTMDADGRFALGHCILNPFDAKTWDYFIMFIAGEDKDDH